MDFNELEKIINFIKINYCDEKDSISLVPQDCELIICINGNRVCYLDTDKICDFEDFGKELDSDTIENIIKASSASSISSEINGLNDVDCDEPLKELENLNCTYTDLIDPCEIANVRKEDIISDIQTLQKWVNKIIKEINKEEK